MKINLLEIINKYRFLLILLGFCLLIASIFIYYLITDQNFNWQTTISHDPGPMSRRLLDGKLVPAEFSALRPIGVVLENHIESRPTAGLEFASIIYETIVEGDITRFLAIFDGQVQVKKIGPVRSVRPFFVEIAQEWNPVLFHAGGSLEALNQLKGSSVRNINEISADGIYFWRDKDRDMPHNLFTSTDLIKRAIEAKEIEMAADFLPWLFKKDEPIGDQNAVLEIEVNFSVNPLYQVKYIYNLEKNDYTRYLANKVHKTERGIVLKAKNIIIQHVDYDIIDSYGRLDINLKSGGEAEIYLDGKKIDGYWKKTKGKTRFFNQNKEEIRLNSGTTWIELMFD